ncbi:MAG: FHA domain-containing protein [Blastocatellia bacterium]
MIELIFTQGPMKGVRFAVRSDAVSLGRTAECDIELNQPNVSRRHAFIKRLGEGLQIIDNNSGNGTFVNGRKIRQAALRRGDEIRIGSHTLRVHIPTGALRGKPSGNTARLRAERATITETSVVYHIRDVSGPEERELEFSCRNLSIGRGDRCRLRLDDTEASRMHAVIQRGKSGFTLIDSQSANGTFLNGARITEQPLADGDEIGIGQTRLTVRLLAGVLSLGVTRADEDAEKTLPGKPREQTAKKTAAAARKAAAQSARLPAGDLRKAAPPPRPTETSPGPASRQPRRWSAPAILAEAPILRLLALAVIVIIVLLLTGRSLAAPLTTDKHIPGLPGRGGQPE